MKTQRAGTSLKFNRYFYDNLMAIYARACFQSKNEISDKLMRNDFNAISSVTPDGTVLRIWKIADKFTNTYKLVDIGKFLIDERLIVQIKYRSARVFFKRYTRYVTLIVDCFRIGKACQQISLL